MRGQSLLEIPDFVVAEVRGIRQWECRTPRISLPPAVRPAEPKLSREGPDIHWRAQLTHRVLGVEGGGVGRKRPFATGEGADLASEGGQIENSLLKTTM